MGREQDKQLYETLRRTGELLQNVRPVEGESYTLESILAEFGSGAAEPALTPDLPADDTAELYAPQQEETPPAEDTAMADKKSLRSLLRFPRRPARPAEPEPDEPEEPEEPEEPPAPEAEDAAPAAPAEDIPDRVRVRDVMWDTVDSAMAENDDGILPPREPLWQRLRRLLAPKDEKHADARRPQDTEELWAPAPRREEPLPPEPEPDDALRVERRQLKHLRRFTLLAAIPALCLCVLAVLEAFSWLPDIWWDDDVIRCATLAAGLAITALLSPDVWRAAFAGLPKGELRCEFAAAVTTVVTLAACVGGAVGFGMSQSPAAAAAAVLSWLCQWGIFLRTSARRQSFHQAAVGLTPPYVVGPTAAGACKQKGTLHGFYHLSDRPDQPALWQRYTVPMLLLAATVLALLVCLTHHAMYRFLWVWSTMLCACVPLGMPLFFPLPMAWLQHRLSRSGVALAGYAGARAVSRGRRLVVTEGDLFPPGTVAFNGYKVFGEERLKMLSYAAAVSHAAGSSLYPLFAQQLAGEGGFRSQCQDLQFYEDGGVGGTIHGETVLMGSAYFMRRRHVALPHDLKLQTGVFLAVDGVLCAIFVIKYQPSRNVEWALRALKRARLRPVLAVRSGNVTPRLLKRKFAVDAHPIYPDVSTRLALSDTVESRGDMACALVYREGLMPLVEAVVGSKRLLTACRVSSVLGHLTGVTGLLLTYYFVSVSAFATLTPLHLLSFALLGLLPTVLVAGLVRHF